MDIRRNRLVVPLAGVACFLLYLLLIFSIPLLDPVQKGDRIWKDFYMLLVLPEEGGEGLDKKLSDAGFPVISKRNALVPFSDYIGLTQVPVKDIGLRFLDFDPRVNDYAKRIGSYFSTAFEGDEREILYVESGDSPLKFSHQLKKILGKEDGTWIIADYNRKGTIFAVAVFILTVSFFMIRTAFPKILPPLAGLPWLLFLILGSGTGGLAPVLLYCACMIALEHLRPTFLEYLNHCPRRPAFWPWICFMLFLALVLCGEILARGAGRRYAFVTVTVTTSAVFCLFLSYGAVLILQHRAREHRLFIPLPLLEPSAYGRGGVVQRRFALIAALVILASLPPLVADRFPGYPVPKPVRCQEACDFSWQSLRRLSERNEPGSLPDLSDFLTHMAYQEGFMYKRDYSFPQPDEMVTVTRFTREGESIFSTTDCVKQFTDLWYEDIMAQASENGITRVLLKQDYPAGVITREIKNRAFVPNNVREQLLVSVIALSPFTVNGFSSREPEQN